MHKIYIQKIIKNQEYIYKVFVFSGKELVWLNGFYSKDLFNTIAEAKVTQLFNNKHFKARLFNGVDVFAEGSNFLCGDKVELQIKSVAVHDLDHKSLKATDKLSIPLGGLVFYPNQRGIVFSRRLREFAPEKANQLLRALNLRAYSGGITLRKQALEHTVQEIDNMVLMANEMYESKLCNDVAYKVFNDMFPFLNKDTEVFSNDKAFSTQILKMYEQISNVVKDVKEIVDFDALDSLWEHFSKRVYSMGDSGSIEIQETKACIAVDVNAGSITNSLEANLCALEMLPKILVFGKFGGKCVVDLIGIQKKSHHALLLKKLKQAFERLNVSAQIFGITSMGMLEIIMPRRGFPLWWINKKF